ncbi:M20/M25/M40 family metallo-hydrolase [Halococcus sp. IIIV-5B]|uniref:M20/M25/M40 family metallo-hydrolase n=1 Tax=Halococcus sp. IIIV-5B TaxID=2321230 RepID=UPI000E743E98|nr:M20/M25/M40 family metallo-hydrolase [Halococcus sp. IIIV-5B]RJT07869.1 M20/M25/M40 family metallo-hydrolase [Halococcus sp. IIIV-5B]
MNAAVDERIDADFETSLDDLFELLAQPSISATDEGVAECTALVENACREYGFDDVKTVETPGQPSVIAHARAEDPDAVPTVLLYGHYDVQPVEADLWETPPFEPTIREGPDGTDRIYARGAGDNKGQWFSHLCAVRALREAGSLPVNVTLLVEGEEESSSPNLEWVVETHAHELAADLTYAADGPIDPSGRPHVLMGARGMLYVQIDAEGPNRDLHSGNFGGPVPNPAWELVRLLGSMKDENGRIAIDGFYDDVRGITDRDREVLADIPFDAAAMRSDLGIDGFADGPGESPLEKLLYYPTLNVPGFGSGYTGEGSKTIIPSTASVKIDMRLVADQDPDDILTRFRDHVERHASGTVDLDVISHGSMTPQRTSLDSPVIAPILDAVGETWDNDPILKPSLGGSLPTYVFENHLGTPCVVVPYANADEDNHSPNENLAVERFRTGIHTTAHVLTNLERSL